MSVHLRLAWSAGALCKRCQHMASALHSAVLTVSTGSVFPKCCRVHAELSF